MLFEKIFSEIFNSKPRFDHERRGMVFYVVLAVVAVMSIFILFYQNFSRQLAFSSFYHVNREKIRNLTDIVIDSAFANLQNVTRDSGHVLSKQIIEQMKTSALNNTSFALQAPLFDAYKDKLLLGLSFKYTLTGRIFDKRTQTPQNLKYYPGEGLATLEILVDATLETPSGKSLARCQRRRHFDVKTSCLVSKYGNRQNSYASTFPLDFALLVRNGLREFKEGYRGQSFNEGLKLMIQDQSSILPSRRGLVYFGRADRNVEESRVFLNTSDDSSGTDEIIPTLPVESFEIGQKECFKLFPASQNSNIRGLKGRFTFSLHPAARTGATENANEKEARNVLSCVSANKKIDQKPAGISLGSFDKAYLDTILCGAVTQRYLYVVHFALDASGIEVYNDGEWYSASENPELAEFADDEFSRQNFVAFSPDCAYLSNNTAADAIKIKESMLRLRQIEQEAGAPLPLVSEMREDLLVYSGQAMSKGLSSEVFKDPPRFFGRDSSPLGDITMTGGEGFRPFRHYTLCSARYFYSSELEKSGVYDKENGILNLRGIVSVESDHLTFNPPAGRDHIIIRGCGAILAPGGFTINCGLKRENPAKDLCVLFTRKGNIRIATSSKIEASLLAFNDSNSASIVPSKAFDVVGSVGVDQLFLNRFPATPSKIEFDQRLRVDSDNDEIFSVTVSPWIRYDEIVFGKE